MMISTVDEVLLRRASVSNACHSVSMVVCADYFTEWMVPSPDDPSASVAGVPGSHVYDFYGGRHSYSSEVQHLATYRGYLDDTRPSMLQYKNISVWAKWHSQL